MLPAILTRNISNARREVQHTSLGNSTVDEGGDVAGGVAKGLDAARHAEVVEEARDGLVEVLADGGVGDRHDGRVGGAPVAEDGEGLAVAVGCGRCGELEDWMYYVSRSAFARNQRTYPQDR